MKNEQKIPLGFFLLGIYLVFLVLWIIEETITLTNPADVFDRFRYVIAGLEIVVAIGSFLFASFFYLELRKKKKEISLSLESIQKLEKDTKLLRSPDSEFSKQMEEQLNSWDFTKVEKEVTYLLMKGYSNQQIAAIRGKSLRTIENQMFSIYQKSSMRGKLELISHFINPLLPEHDD